ncbi:MAG: S-methyl-5-thioribose-1-phosphate isomerase [Clostridiaceae bacterium]|nr:S-methyl-5-thioribose-1-phosphate isomerase [Clostridiaceae bacterium]
MKQSLNPKTPLVPVRLTENHDALVLLDQTGLPAEEKYLTLKSLPEIHAAIYRLSVRGAPAIGIAAAYAVYLAARYSPAQDYDMLEKDVDEACRFLATARPTAVNLFWALDRMRRCLRSHPQESADQAREILLREAQAIHAEDTAVCRLIGENGLTLLQPGFGLLTHCNAGSLATSAYGTALAPIYLGQERDYHFHVFADETRPLLQGARLTAYELQRAGVDVTLICDNMAATVMEKGWVQAVLVGCDRVAANGDAANKIGTAGAAILARYFNIPFYVCAPASTLDFQCADGRAIHIEERRPEEITELGFSHRMAPSGIKVYNPAFDITDHRLISAFITEKGVLYPPFEQSLTLLRP